VLDSSIGMPRRCLDLLVERIERGQAVNDLNWLRLRTWRESLAMVFDPPAARAPWPTWCSWTSMWRVSTR
jgi:glucose-6-phosphate dehydrogenase assembly protein OpcA